MKPTDLIGAASCALIFLAPNTTGTIINIIIFTLYVLLNFDRLEEIE